MQFSFDPAPEVRAEAGRSLALLLARPSTSSELLEARLAALLAEDGLLVPTLTLRGLKELGTALPSFVQSQLSRLAAEHSAQSIRLAAAELMKSPGAPFL